MVKNPNWQEADQLAINKRGRGVELRVTEKQLLLTWGLLVHKEILKSLHRLKLSDSDLSTG